jgi:hypothetical protein
MISRKVPDDRAEWLPTADADLGAPALERALNPLL